MGGSSFAIASSWEDSPNPDNGYTMVIQWLYNGYRMLYNCYIIVISWLLHVIIIMDQYTYIHIYTCTISEATVRPHSCLFKHRLIWHEGSLEVISAGVEHVRKILPSGYLT